MGRQGWQDKVAAGFTNSAGVNGDKLNALTSMAIFAAQHGMHWVNLGLLPGWLYTSTGRPDDLNRLGGFLGAMAQSPSDLGPDVAPSEADLRTAEHLGRRVALPPSQLVHGRGAAQRECMRGMTTPLTDLLGIEHPDRPGPVRRRAVDASTLAAAVSNAGGLGSFGAHNLQPDQITALVKDLRQATDRPFAVNLWVPQPAEEDVPRHGDALRDTSNGCARTTTRSACRRPTRRSRSPSRTSTPRSTRPSTPRRRC